MVHRPQPIGPEGLLEGLRPRAILRGFLWDCALSIAASVALASLFLEDGVFQSRDDEIDAVFASTRFCLLALPAGLGCTVIGGFLAGRGAGTHPVKNGVAVGIAGLLLGIAGSLVPSTGPASPWWFDFLGFVLILPAGAAGGALARREPPGPVV